jgi:uncharacterized membrane protein YcaP (DUF421 family)
MVQQGVTQSDYSVTGLLIATATFALLSVLISYTNLRFPRVRQLLEGEPFVVVRDGKLISKNLRRERLTTEDIQAEARQQQIDSLSKVSGRSSRQAVRSASSPSRRGLGRTCL